LLKVSKIIISEIIPPLVRGGGRRPEGFVLTTPDFRFAQIFPLLEKEGSLVPPLTSLAFGLSPSLKKRRGV